MALVRATLVSTVFAVAVIGCADTGGQTLIVLNNSVPDTGCVIDPAGTNAFIAAGRIDATGVNQYGSISGYLITPAIENLADSQDGALTAQRTVLLEGARVDVAIGPKSNGEDLLDGSVIEELTAANALKYTALFTGAVEPDGGLTGVAFEVVPAPVVARIGQALGEGETGLVTAKFTIFGHTVNGSGVEADEYTYPITVCNGCLFTHLGSCLGLPEGDYPAGGACNLFQDSPGTCCTSTSNPPFEVCPAVTENIGQ